MSKEVFEAVFQEEIYAVRVKPLVVIQESWNTLGPKEKELLSKIIGALKLPIEAIQIISRPDLDIESFKGKVEKIIYFGSNDHGYTNYEPITLSGVSFICSDSLSELLPNEATKKQLWLAMKKLFLS
jgi:DNA polymerase III psi subunit